MVGAILAFIIPFFPPVLSPDMTGFASQYGKSPTDGTIVYRQSVGDLPNDISLYDGLIATNSCEHMGKEATVVIDGKSYFVVVFDCSGDAETKEWMQQNRIIFEVDYYLAERIGIIGRGGIEARLCWH